MHECSCKRNPHYKERTDKEAEQQVLILVREYADAEIQVESLKEEKTVAAATDSALNRSSTEQSSSPPSVVAI